MRAELDERDVSEIKVGQVASVRAAAFPGKEFAGTRDLDRAAGRAVAARRARHRATAPTSMPSRCVVKLAQPGPLTAGMKVDVYFSQEKAGRRQSKN